IQKQQTPRQVAEDADRSRKGISLSLAAEVVGHRSAEPQLIDPATAIQNDLSGVVAKLLRLVHPRGRDRGTKLLSMRDLLRQQLVSLRHRSQQTLVRSVLQQLNCRRSIRKLRHSTIEERCASLDAHRHTRLVYLHHVVIWQLIACLEQPNRLKQVAACLIEIATHRRQKLRELAAVAPARITPIELEQPPGHRTSQGAGGLKDRIATEQLVRAFADQDDFDASLAALLVHQSSRNGAPVREQ